MKSIVNSTRNTIHSTEIAMKYLILIATVFIQLVLSGRTYSSFDPPTRSEVVPTIRRSLQRSLPADVWRDPLSKYLSPDTITTLQDVITDKHLSVPLEVSTHSNRLGLLRWRTRPPILRSDNKELRNRKRKVIVVGLGGWWLVLVSGFWWGPLLLVSQL